MNATYRGIFLITIIEKQGGFKKIHVIISPRGVNMLLEEKIKSLSKISHSEKAIADYLLEEKSKIKDMSTRDIAKATFTSSATVVRFSQRLGYSGFIELKKDYISELKYISEHFCDIDPNFPFNEKDSFMNIAGKMSNLVKETIDDSLSLVNHDSLQKAVYLLNNTHRIFLFAIGTSALLGEMFKQKMTRISKTVVTEYLVGEYGFHCNLIEPQDCAILISYTGETHNVIQYAKKLKEMNIPTIIITSLDDNTLKEYSHIVLHVSTREKQFSKIATFTSEYSIQFILDVLYSCYFSLNYQKNLETKTTLSKYEEQTKNIKVPIIKE